MQASQCLLYRSLQERREGLEVFINIPKEEEKEEDEEEKEEDEEKKKKDDDEEEEMEGKTRDKEDRHDSLVVEEGMMSKFPMLPFATYLLPLQLLLSGSFCHEEVKQPHHRGAKRPNIMNYLVPLEIPSFHC